MSRISEVKPEDMTPDQKRISQEIASVRHGQLRGPFAIWIRIPEIADTANRFGNALRLHGKLDRKLFELMVAIIARDWSAQFEWFVHMRSGIEAGLSPEIYESIRTHRVPKFINENEQLVYELVNELIRTKTLSRTSYDRGVAGLGKDNMIELVTGVGFYSTVAMMLNAFEYPVSENVRADKSPLD